MRCGLKGENTFNLHDVLQAPRWIPHMPVKNTWLIVGLGNPGTTYQETRHNAGFMVVDDIADRFGIPIGRLHPMARKYADGFTQPALFAYKGDEQVYSWITQPKLTNLFGAARRPTPKEVVEALQERLGSGD